MDQQLALYLRLTKDCNAKCFMCEFWKNSNHEFISDEQFDHVLDKDEQTGVRLIRFTGGEPLLCWKLPSYIQRCHSSGIKTSVVTNGILLPQQMECLVETGLDQIVISIDGSTPELHNSIRRTEGLLEIVENTLVKISKSYPSLRVRINTVVSMRNIRDLSSLAGWLEQHGVSQWSIIPIKLDGYRWSDSILFEDFLRAYHIFRETVIKSSLNLMGYSGQWAGIDDKECRRFWSGEISVHPKRHCHLVKMVSFYDPFKGRYYPCNCTPHRREEHTFDIPAQEVAWYYENGFRYCKGCEPLNAYCADFPETMYEDIFNF
jgi:cytosylglucuronate decarboxylase